MPGFIFVISNSKALQGINWKIFYMRIFITYQQGCINCIQYPACAEYCMKCQIGTSSKSMRGWFFHRKEIEVKTDTAVASKVTAETTTVLNKSAQRCKACFRFSCNWKRQNILPQEGFHKFSYRLYSAFCFYRIPYELSVWDIIRESSAGGFFRGWCRLLGALNRIRWTRSVRSSRRWRDRSPALAQTLPWQLWTRRWLPLGLGQNIPCRCWGRGN